MSDAIRNLINDIRNKKNEILSDFSKSYLAETGLMPSQVTMCYQMCAAGIIKIWFEKRKDEKIIE